jgi:hypothetical protein
VQLQPSLLFWRKRWWERSPDWLSTERKLCVQDLELKSFFGRQTSENPPPILIEDVSIRLQTYSPLETDPAPFLLRRVDSSTAGHALEKARQAGH